MRKNPATIIYERIHPMDEIRVPRRDKVTNEKTVFSTHTGSRVGFWYPKLISLAVVMLIITLGISFTRVKATISYFSDTEHSYGNSLKAGSLQFSVAADGSVDAHIGLGTTNGKTIIPFMAPTDGSFPIVYRVSIEKMGGVATFCNALQASATTSPFSYNGSLQSLATGTTTVPGTWQLGIFLPSDTTGVTDGDMCSLNLVYSGWIDGGTEGSGYQDQKKVSLTLHADIPQAKLIHHWPLDEGSGAIANDIIGSANMTLINDPTRTAGRVGSGALSFDGISQYASVPSLDLSDTSVVTISFWMNVPAFADNDEMAMELSDNYNYNDNTFNINPNDSTSHDFRFCIRSGGFKYLCKGFARPSAGVWHHYVFIFDNSTASGDSMAYVDGIAPTLTLGLSDKTGSGNFANLPLYLMARYRKITDGNTGLFQSGSMDDVRIYDHALTAGEVSDLYTASPPPPPPFIPALIKIIPLATSTPDISTSTPVIYSQGGGGSAATGTPDATATTSTATTTIEVTATSTATTTNSNAKTTDSTATITNSNATTTDSTATTTDSVITTDISTTTEAVASSTPPVIPPANEEVGTTTQPVAPIEDTPPPPPAIEPSAPDPIIIIDVAPPAPSDVPDVQP